MARAVIVDAVRTPMAKGKTSGALAGTHPVDLLATVLIALTQRNDVDPAEVDDVLIGCVSQIGEQSGSVGRQAVFAAGWPTHVPSTTVERKCGSGQQALEFAAHGISAGAYDVAIAGGVESMSRVPIGSARNDADPFGPRVRERFPDLVPQGVSAELMAQRWGLTRDELDEYSAGSHERAAKARSAGAFDGEIVPVGEFTVDETVREGTTASTLGELQPAFAKPPYTERFADIEWKVTAGSSSQITDGASALLLMSEERAAALGLRPRAEIHASAVVGDDPTLMLAGPIPATRRVLERAGLAIADIDAFEVNEAFASVPLAWQREMDVDPERLNPLGGAIALGHPLGASGARLATTLLNHLERTGGTYGLQTMCEAGGMANATVFRRL